MRLILKRINLILIFFVGFIQSANSEIIAMTDIEELKASIILDIRYASKDNFTAKQIYDQAKCYLRKEVAENLVKVQNDLQKQGLGLKVYDCYRPLSAQKKLWKIMPDPRYVADPSRGSRHNRGAAVDLTLTDSEGNELKMPTEYDDFSEKAHRDYNKLSKDVIKNRHLLEISMEKHGFKGLSTEWWHFDFQGWEKYGILDIDFEQLDK